MANVRVKLRLKRINQLMRSQPVQSEVARRAQRIRRAAGENFEVSVKPHKWTARAYIRPANAEGAEEEARDKRLSGALNAGR